MRFLVISIFFGTAAALSAGNSCAPLIRYYFILSRAMGVCMFSSFSLSLSRGGAWNSLSLS